MIVRIVHPDDASQVAFLPLRFDRDSDQWVSLLPPDKFMTTEASAAMVCLHHVQTHWDAVLRVGRVVQALCDHPAFALEGINADIVRTETQWLARVMGAVNDELPHLLSEPGKRDQVEVDFVLADELVAAGQLAVVVAGSSELVQSDELQEIEETYEVIFI